MRDQFLRQRCNVTVHIEILGSAAGGGFPQWNCNCRNCGSLRAGTFPGKARTQTQVAVSGDNHHQFLLNASPDLRLQIETTPTLRPRSRPRGSPISGVVLTSADVDQVAGLLSLRELQPFRIYSTASLRRVLREDNSMFAMLNRMPHQVSWDEISPGRRFHLLDPSGSDSGIVGDAFFLGNRFPAYVSQERTAALESKEALLGLILESSSGKKLAYLPAVPAIDDSLLQRLASADLVLFDGTFWSEDELIQVQGSGATAREMGHVPVSGADGSLRKLAGLHRPRKLFIHINNTNPMLDESGTQYRQVRDAGWEVATDGCSFDL